MRKKDPRGDAKPRDDRQGRVKPSWRHNEQRRPEAVPPFDIQKEEVGEEILASKRGRGAKDG